MKLERIKNIDGIKIKFEEDFIVTTADEVSKRYTPIIKINDKPLIHFPHKEVEDLLKRIGFIKKVKIKLLNNREELMLIIPKDTIAQIKCCTYLDRIYIETQLGQTKISVFTYLGYLVTDTIDKEEGLNAIVSIPEEELWRLMI